MRSLPSILAEFGAAAAAPRLMSSGKLSDIQILTAAIKNDVQSVQTEGQ